VLCCTVHRQRAAKACSNTAPPEHHPNPCSLPHRSSDTHERRKVTFAGGPASAGGCFTGSNLGKAKAITALGFISAEPCSRATSNHAARLALLLALVCRGASVRSVRIKNYEYLFCNQMMRFLYAFRQHLPLDSDAFCPGFSDLLRNYFMLRRK